LPGTNSGEQEPIHKHGNATIDFTSGSTMNRLSGGSALKIASPKEKRAGQTIPDARKKTLSEAFAIELMAESQESRPKVAPGADGKAAAPEGETVTYTSRFDEVTTAHGSSIMENSKMEQNLPSNRQQRHAL